MTRPLARPGALRTARTRAQLVGGRTDWYRIARNAAEPRVAEVMIYDEIGFFGVTAADFVRDLNALNVDRIDLRLNTPGGDAFDGIAIYNALRAHRARVDVYVDALAASAGSVIAMAGDRVTMRRSSQMMIHDALALEIGNAADMRAMADLLDRLSDDLAATYVGKAGGTVEAWRGRMQAETWYSAAEAVTAGLADANEDDEPQGTGGDPTAGFDLSVFRYPRGRVQAPAPVDVLDPVPPPPPPDPPAESIDDDPWSARWDAELSETLRLAIEEQARDMPAEPARAPEPIRQTSPETEDDHWAIDPAVFHNALRGEL